MLNYETRIEGGEKQGNVKKTLWLLTRWGRDESMRKGEGTGEHTENMTPCWAKT